MAKEYLISIYDVLHLNVALMMYYIIAYIKLTQLLNVITHAEACKHTREQCAYTHTYICIYFDIHFYMHTLVRTHTQAHARVHVSPFLCLYNVNTQCRSNLP